MAAVNTAATRRNGRRQGPDSTRGDILRVAREAFARHGFDGTSVRGIAGDAKVDPSTVIHFFKTKEGLFRAVIGDIAPAAEPFVAALRRGADGTEVARRYLQLWEDADSGPAVRAVVRTAISSERAIELVHQTLLGLVEAAVPAPDALSAELAMSHLLGVALGRHITRLPALAAADVAAIAERVGPVLDAYLTS